MFVIFIINGIKKDFGIRYLPTMYQCKNIMKLNDFYFFYYKM